MVNRWPTLDRPNPPAQPQQHAKDAFPPDKEMQGDLEVVILSRGAYGDIKRTSEIRKTDDNAKAKKKHRSPSPWRTGETGT